MGKNYSKRESKASLIFIWIVIALLLVGMFFIVKSYKEQHSEIISSEALETALSTAMKKPAGKITAEELAGVEGVDLYAMGDSTIALYYLKGFDEKSKAGEDTSAYIAQVTLSKEEFLKDLPLFKGVKSLNILNYSGTDFIFDMNSIAADKFTKLESFNAVNATIDNNNLIGTHKGLKELTLSGAGLTAIPDISKLTSLEYIDLSSNELTSVEGLKGLNNDKITNIVLSGNTIEDLSPIAHIDQSKIITDPVIDDSIEIVDDGTTSIVPSGTDTAVTPETSFETAETPETTETPEAGDTTESVEDVETNENAENTEVDDTTDTASENKSSTSEVASADAE